MFDSIRGKWKTWIEVRSVAEMKWIDIGVTERLVSKP